MALSPFAQHVQPQDRRPAVNWFLLSLYTAFALATEAALLKRWFSDLGPWDMCAIPFFYSLPLYAIGLAFVEIPVLQPGYWPIFAWILPLTMIAVIFHFRAIYSSPLSLTMPFLAFTPVFVIITGHVLLGETLGIQGIGGILLVVAGGYVLNLDSTSSGWLAPIKAIGNEPGSLYMLVAASLYGLCAVGGKMLVLRSSPWFAGIFFFLIFDIALVGMLLLTRRTTLKQLCRKPGKGIVAGVVVVTEIIAHHLAISLVHAAYMVAIKRLAGIFAVGYGWLWFREANIRCRLLGTAIMTAGAMCIAAFG